MQRYLNQHRTGQYSFYLNSVIILAWLLLLLKSTGVFLVITASAEIDHKSNTSKKVDLSQRATIKKLVIYDFAMSNFTMVTSITVYLAYVFNRPSLILSSDPASTFHAHHTQNR